MSNLITEMAKVKEEKKDTDNKDQQGKEIREAAMLSLKRPGKFYFILDYSLENSNVQRYHFS